MLQLQQKYQEMNPLNGKVSQSQLQSLAEEASLAGYDDVYNQTQEKSAVTLNKMNSSEGLVMDASDV